MRVFVARHGERCDFVSPWCTSASGISDDAALTAFGEGQARRLGQHLQKIGARLTRIYSSPFERCVRTAALVAAEYDRSSDVSSYVRVCVEPGLSERLSFPVYWRSPGGHGPSWKQVSQLSTSVGTIDNNSRICLSYSPVLPMQISHSAYPESRQSFRERCARVVADILIQHDPSYDVLLIAHVSSVLGIVSTICPDTFLWFTRVSCTSLQLFLFLAQEYQSLSTNLRLTVSLTQIIRADCSLTEFKSISTDPHNAETESLASSYHLLRLCNVSFLPSRREQFFSKPLSLHLATFLATIRYVLLVTIGFLYSFIATAPPKFSNTSRSI